ncbi:MAG: helix-turn-helix transcriptional regulator [Ruminococcus sp.]|nr:helix-turn-helix transcriptional regulator [Ruminococcus sp.]
MRRIKELRKEKDISQISLSMKINVSQKMVSAYENGKNEPSIATLIQLADIFGTSVDYLVEYTDIRQPIDKIAQTQLNDIECDLLNEFRSLSKEKQSIALGIILGLKHR